MRRLWPEPGDVDDVAALVAAEERPPAGDRPWLLVNMVASLDGGVTVEGRSGGLAGAADKALFGALRQVADVVLAGAGTVRAEGYGPPKATDEVRALRRARGQGEVPRLAVVSRRLDLDPAARLFSDPDNRPYVITHTAAPPIAWPSWPRSPRSLAFGDDEVDLVAALAHLRAEGAAVVTCEGGPDAQRRPSSPRPDRRVGPHPLAAPRRRRRRPRQPGMARRPAALRARPPPRGRRRAPRPLGAAARSPGVDWRWTRARRRRSVALGLGALGEGLDLALEVAEVVEAQVDAGEADRGHGIGLAQPLEHAQAHRLGATPRRPRGGWRPRRR